MFGFPCKSFLAVVVLLAVTVTATGLMVLIEKVKRFNNLPNTQFTVETIPLLVC